MEYVKTAVEAKLTPFIERITLLESSIEKKDTEIILLLHTVQT